MGIDPLAAVAAFLVMTTVVVAMFAFFGAAVPAAAMRGRLEGLMSGTSVIEASGASGALRKSGIGKGLFSGFARGNIAEQLELQLERADMSIRPGEYIFARIALAGLGLVVP